MARRAQRKVQVAWYGDEFVRLVGEYSEPALWAAATILERAAVARTPRVTGNLAKSAYVATRKRSTFVVRRYWRKKKKVFDDHTAVVAYSAPHAHLIESGRRKVGPIRPRRAQALRIEGRFRAASRYRRTSGRHFLGEAIDATKATMVEELAAVLREGLEREMPKGKR